MLNKKQLDKVRASLPPLGYKLIAEVLGNTTDVAVKTAMSTPDRFKDRKDIADAIVVVMDNYRKQQQKTAENLMNAIK